MISLCGGHTRPSAALLISRQPLRPCGDTPWVRKAIEAVTWVQRQDMTLLTSVGMQTWEMVTSIGSDAGVRMRVICVSPRDRSPDTTNALFSSFQLDPGLVSIEQAGTAGASLCDEHGRDNMIASQADLLLPISLRRNGRMEMLIAQAEERCIPVLWNFYSGPPARTSGLAYDLSALTLNSEIACLSDRYLIHWTRASNGPWPDERPIDFYRAIARSSGYPRSGYDTLCHVLNSRVLRASRRHMPENEPCVSFTALSPHEVIPLMRWRARYTQMSFEPYGIGILKDVAESLGLRPVEYYVRGRSTVPAGPGWLTQSVGVKSDWRQENEWRHKGDVDLRQLPVQALRAFCLTVDEARTVRDRFGIAATAVAAG